MYLASIDRPYAVCSVVAGSRRRQGEPHGAEDARDTLEHFVDRPRRRRTRSWSWDVTSLIRANVRGIYRYLYLVIDVSSGASAGSRRSLRQSR